MEGFLELEKIYPKRLIEKLNLRVSVESVEPSEKEILNLIDRLCFSLLAIKHFRK